MRALVVDDSRVMRRVKRGALRQAGIENVDEAIDCRGAIEAVRSSHDDLILMDWNMPNVNGLEAVLEIREAGVTTPIIMVTTEKEKDRVLETVRAGVNGFITKPFTPDTIISKIQSVVGSLPD